MRIRGLPFLAVVVGTVLVAGAATLAVAAFATWRGGDTSGALVLAVLALLVALPPSWDPAVRLKERTSSKV